MTQFVYTVLSASFKHVLLQFRVRSYAGSDPKSRSTYFRIAKSIIVSSKASSTMIERREVPSNSKQGCCSLISRAELVLLILLGITVTFFIAALVIIAWFLMTAQNVCESPSCIRSSSQLLEIIDFTTPPCEDFHKFLCGNYIPSDQRCEDENRLKNQSIISVLTDNSDSESLVLVKKFYQVCTDAVAAEANDNDTLLTIIDKIGGWPLLLGQNWNENDFKWLNFMVDLRTRGFKYDWFISFDYYVDSDGINYLMIAPPDLKTITNQSSLYHDAMIDVVSKLGSSNRLIWDDMQKIVEFERELENINRKARHKFPENANDQKIRTTNLQTLNGTWSKIDLVDILNAFARGYAFFDNNTMVVLADETYIYDLNLLLRKTAKRIKANYIVWKIIESYLPFCSENLRQIYGKYTNLPSREDHCLAETTRRFYGGLETYISTKEKDDQIRRSVKLMASLIQKQIGSGAEDIKVIITGFQIDNSGISETNSIIKMINEVNMRTDNAFFNCLHKKSTVCSKGGYYHNSEHLEIYYDINHNTIYIPFVLLHSDSYRWDQPNYINYGRLGRTLGNVFKEAMHERNRPSDNDLSGVELAYKSYLEWMRKGGTERKLPAINYTSSQLFWIHSSSKFCSSGNDPDSFHEVNNSSYFREDFNCEKCKFCAL